MADELEWPFSITGNAAEQLELVDQALVGLPEDIDAVEKALKKMDRAFAAAKIAKIADPMKQNHALLQQRAKDLRDRAGGGDEKDGVGGGIAKGLGLADMAKLGTAAGLAEAGAQAIVGALKDGISAAASLTKEFVTMSIAAHEAKVAEQAGMKALEGDLGQTVLDDLDSVRDAGHDVGESVKAYQDLRRAGLDTAASMDVLAASFDLATLKGGSEEASKAFQELFGKMQTLGKVGSKDLARLTETGIELPELADALGARIGKTSDQALALLRKGDAKSIDVQNAMLDVAEQLNSGRALGSAAKDFADNNVTMQFARVKDIAGELFEDVDTKPLADAAKTIGNVMQGALGDRVKDVAGRAFGWIANTVNGIDFEKWLGRGVGLIEGISGGFDSFMMGLNPAVHAIEQMDEQMDRFNEAMGVTSSSGEFWTFLGFAVGGVVLSFVALGEAIAVVWHLLEKVVDAIGWVAKASADGTGGAESVKALFGFGKDSAQGMADGLRAGQAEVRKAAAEVAATVPAAVSTELDIHSPSRVMGDLGHDTVDGLENALAERDPGALLDFGRFDAPDFGENLNARGGINVTVNVTVIGGTDPEDVGRRAGRAAGDELLTMLADLEAA